MRFTIGHLFSFILAFALLFAVLPYVFDFFSFVRNPLGGFVGEFEFVDLTGRQAKQKLLDWPELLDSSEVQFVTCKHQYSRDSFSTWYRIKLSKAVADFWQDHIHDQCRPNETDWSDDFYEGFEGVNRTVAGPPPLHMQTGTTPVWWNPSPSNFRATELMIWYRNYDSGIGQAAYSSFDDSKGELWIYEYSSQHDILWSSGEAPEGDCFGNIEQDELLD